MASADQKTEVVLPAEVLEEMPLPSDRRVTFLGGLFVLALLAAAYVASEIVLPLVFAITLKLLLQPALRAVERLHVPRTYQAGDAGYTFSRRIVKRERRKAKPAPSLEQIAVDAFQSTRRASKKNPVAALRAPGRGGFEKGSNSFSYT